MTTTSKKAALKSLIEEGNLDGVLPFFQDMSEDERATLFPVVASELLRLADVNVVIVEKSRGESPEFRRRRLQFAVTGAAFWATAPEDAVCRRKLWNYASYERLVDLLSERRPQWLQKWADWVIKNDRPFYWFAIYLLHRRGLVNQPGDEGYVLWLILGGPVRIWDEVSTVDLKAFLTSEPGLLESLFWRLFEIEGDSVRSVAQLDKRGRDRGGYARALRELSAEGLLDRQRLLDASLSALSRGFKSFRAHWYLVFHESLMPTSQERLARLSTYLSLLPAPNAATVTFAVHALCCINREHKLPSEVLCHLGVALSVPVNATIRNALRLMFSIAAREPNAVPIVQRLIVPMIPWRNLAIQKLVSRWIDQNCIRDDK